MVECTSHKREVASSSLARSIKKNKTEGSELRWHNMLLPMEKDLFIVCIMVNTSQHEIMKCIEGLDNRQYAPRVLQELFDL